MFFLFSNPDKNLQNRRYLECPGTVKVQHLKKFIIMKYGLGNIFVVRNLDTSCFLPYFDVNHSFHHFTFILKFSSSLQISNRKNNFLDRHNLHGWHNSRGLHFDWCRLLLQVEKGHANEIFLQNLQEDKVDQTNFVILSRTYLTDNLNHLHNLFQNIPQTEETKSRIREHKDRPGYRAKHKTTQRKPRGNPIKQKRRRWQNRH